VLLIDVLFVVEIFAEEIFEDEILVAEMFEDETDELEISTMLFKFLIPNVLNLVVIFYLLQFYFCEEPPNNPLPKNLDDGP
jgi:hypothetical protein